MRLIHTGFITFLLVPTVAAAATARGQEPQPQVQQPEANAPGSQAPESQETPAPKQPTLAAPQEPHFILLRYPADRETTVAVVGDRPYSLGDLVAYIEERHYPRFAELLETQPGFQRYLRSDLIAPWVRHFADIKALELANADRDIDQEKLDAAISARLKTDFEAHLARYVEGRANSGHPAELSQKQVNRLLTNFQLQSGLAMEVQGWLDYLEPGEYSRDQLHAFYTGNARTFGGAVTIEHILIQHRDSGTGILLRDEGRGLASTRIAQIKASLEPDGSNFAEVARMYSEDSRTRQDGGKIIGIHRFDDRLPPEICRAAWALKDGEMSDVVESRYGWHIIRRLEFTQHIFILFSDDAMPTIKGAMQRSRQENLMFSAREKAKVELRL
ncbi:MAG: peptidylprolyl isomerase [Planctomycetes bacterium]|nr:peptidylprolyl isomerase [Planctomycetota bacterium]